MWILNIVVWPKQLKRWNTYKIKTPGPTVCPRWAINSSLLLLLASIIVVIWAFIGQKDQPDAYKLKITILLFWNKQKQNINPINPLRGRIERQKTPKRTRAKRKHQTNNKLWIWGDKILGLIWFSKNSPETNSSLFGWHEILLLEPF